MGYVDVGVVRDAKRFGELYEKDVVLHPLPSVGTYVKVYEIEKKSGDKRHSYSYEYKASESYTDIWRRPCIYKVVGYVTAKDDALNCKNKILLRHITTNLEKCIPTSWVARGVTKLLIVGDDEVQEYAI